MTGVAMFSVIEKSSGQWWASSPLNPLGWPEPEVGGASRARQRGLRQRAGRPPPWTTLDAGWSEVIHCIDEQNLASQGVAKRLGSSYLRRVRMPVPFEHMPVDAWGQTREQWKTRFSAQ
jgi:hypothetical protein